MAKGSGGSRWSRKGDAGGVAVGRVGPGVCRYGHTNSLPKIWNYFEITLVGLRLEPTSHRSLNTNMDD